MFSALSCEWEIRCFDLRAHELSILGIINQLEMGIRPSTRRSMVLSGGPEVPRR